MSTKIDNLWKERKREFFHSLLSMQICYIRLAWCFICMTHHIQIGITAQNYLKSLKKNNNETLLLPLQLPINNNS